MKLESIKAYVKKAHSIATAHGFHDEKKSDAHWLCLVISELMEAVEADRKDYRADIVVYDRRAHPVMVVECKRPEVTLDQDVVDQALRYNQQLDVKYIAITNGPKTFIFQRQADGWQFMQKAPLWGEMADGKGRADGKMADGKDEMR